MNQLYFYGNAYLGENFGKKGKIECIGMGSELEKEKLITTDKLWFEIVRRKVDNASNCIIVFKIVNFGEIWKISKIWNVQYNLYLKIWRFSNLL